LLPQYSRRSHFDEWLDRCKRQPLFFGAFFGVAGGGEGDLSDLWMYTPSALVSRPAAHCGQAETELPPFPIHSHEERSPVYNLCTVRACVKGIACRANQPLEIGPGVLVLVVSLRLTVFKSAYTSDLSLVISVGISLGLSILSSSL